MPVVTLAFASGSGAGVGRSFAAQLRRRIPIAARDVAASTGREVSARLEGERRNPRRIDTERLQSAWNAGFSEVSGKVTGPTGAQQAGDAVSIFEATDGTVHLAVQVSVPYVLHVEYGTEKMVAGFHVRDATRAARQPAAQIFGKTVLLSWRAAV